MAYMDFNEYKQLMKYGGYKQSRAVKVYVDRAAHYSRMKKQAMAISAEHPSNLISNYVKHFERLRVESVWKALWIAESEKKQNWRYLEDVDNFLSTLEELYNDDVTKFSEVDQLKIELAELYKELEREQQKGEWRD